MSIITKDEKNEIRQYLLGHMAEADKESLELRLLTDSSFGEEFDIIVDEIIDQYIEGGFEGEERERVEQYFLKAPERGNKLRFASGLLHHASVERGDKATNVNVRRVVPPEPGIFERALLFWRSQALSLRLVTTIATVLILMSVGLQIYRRPTSGTFASIKLTISNAERGVGAETKRVKMAPGVAGVRLELTLPDQIPQAKSYRVEMLNDDGSPRFLAIKERHDQSLIVEIPANELAQGSYIIHIYVVNDDGTVRRIGGNYSFGVE